MIAPIEEKVSDHMTAIEQVTIWKESAAEILDVRPELAQGGEPFERILTAAIGIPAGESLVLIAPFEPAPLYSVLSARGFSHTTAQVAADEWVVRFTAAS